MSETRNRTRARVRPSKKTKLIARVETWIREWHDERAGSVCYFLKLAYIRSSASVELSKWSDKLGNLPQEDASDFYEYLLDAHRRCPDIVSAYSVRLWRRSLEKLDPVNFPPPPTPPVTLARVIGIAGPWRKRKGA